MALAGVASLAWTAMTFASPQAGAEPRFEVASIKQAPLSLSERQPGAIQLGLRMNKAQATFGGMTLSALISYAYGVKLAQISGPDWLPTRRFDIVAKLPEGGSAERVPEMMQGLLAERFDLKAHRGVKEFRVYALMPVGAGIKLTPRPEDFDPKAHSDQMALPILSLTLLLEQIVDLPVVDETGLEGQYLFSSQVIRQVVTSGAQRATSAGGNMPEASEPASADVAALLLPVGMKLEKKKANLPVLVVESMRQTPTEN